jgi:endonuclease/exonuclease/phosphatase family metal-dependent hydrolase
VNTTSEPQLRKRFALIRWIAHQIFPLWVIIWINGVILRLTLRDSVDLVAPLYYATPWPVLALMTLPFVFVVWRKPKMVLGVLVVAHLFAAAWILESWRSGEAAKGPADLKVVQWNVNRPVKLLDGTVARMREFDADIITVAEPTPELSKAGANTVAALQDRWRAAWKSDYQVRFANGNILALIRGEVLGERSGELAKGSYYALYDLNVKGRALRLLQVDVYARPNVSRRAPLSALVSLADSLSDQPLIIAGDFNTPRDSVFIDPLRAHHRNAWETAGTHGADTWPWPVPVLSLDQIWSNAALRPLRCETAGNWRSDHLWIQAEYLFQAETEQSQN